MALVESPPSASAMGILHRSRNNQVDIGVYRDISFLLAHHRSHTRDLVVAAENVSSSQSKSATAAGVNPASSSCRCTMVSASLIRRPSVLRFSR